MSSPHAKRSGRKIEQQLQDLGVTFSGYSRDDYDNSIELYSVPDEDRLSPEAQSLLLNGWGFSVVYVNHFDRWETHYRLGRKPWRVSYPHKRGDKGGAILVEERVNGWPDEWFSTGYAQILERKAK